MPNLDVTGPIIVFREDKEIEDETRESGCDDYSLAREMAERAAAKRSGTEAGRRIHQQLAEMHRLRRQARRSSNG